MRTSHNWTLSRVSNFSEPRSVENSMSCLYPDLTDEDTYDEQQQHNCSQFNMNSVMDYCNKSLKSIRLGLEEIPYFVCTNGLFDGHSSESDSYTTPKVVFTKREKPDIY